MSDSKNIERMKKRGEVILHDHPNLPKISLTILETRDVVLIRETEERDIENKPSIKNITITKNKLPKFIAILNSIYDEMKFNELILLLKKHLFNSKGIIAVFLVSETPPFDLRVVVKSFSIKFETFFVKKMMDIMDKFSDKYFDYMVFAPNECDIEHFKSEYRTLFIKNDGGKVK